MKWTRQKTLASCISLGGLVLVCIWAASREPTYQGQAMSDWFKRLPVTSAMGGPAPIGGFSPGRMTVQRTQAINSFGQTYGDTKVGLAAIEAFEHFGTNAGPYLLRKLQATDSGFELLARSAATKFHIKWLPFRIARLEQGQAVTGLIRLPKLPPDIKQSLERLTNNVDAALATSASLILRERALTWGDRW